jgi:hypothetical protein
MGTNWYTAEWLADQYWICNISSAPSENYTQLCSTKPDKLQTFWALPMNRYVFSEYGKKEPVKYLKEIITGCRLVFL